MKRLQCFLAAVCLLYAACSAYGQQSASFLLLGDMHFDRAEDHDLEWLKARPNSYHQSTTQYQVYTRENWGRFMKLLQAQVASLHPPVQAIIQAGDLQQGVAGKPELALQMARHTIEALRPDEFSMPWVLVKGNHEITGPGAVKAYNEVIIPFLRDRLKQDISQAYYSCRFGDVEIICLDSYEKSGAGLLPFLEKRLAGSTARWKFVVLHEPVIPVSSRCWHVFRRPQDSEARGKLLNLLARHQAVVLCGHLHKYSVVRRTTPAGPVVQVMMNSVISDPARRQPAWSTTRYGPELIEQDADFEPSTREQRKQVLAEESKYITDFRLADLPGYGVLVVNGAAGRLLLRMYAGLSDRPYEEVDLSKLLRQDAGTEAAASKPAMADDDG